MKAWLEPLGSSVLNSFLVRKFEEKNFSAPYHFHPEYELTFIVKGQGKRYVGANMQDFYHGDFVLLGANLPHCWKNEKTKRGEKVSSVVVQFQKEFLGSDFFEKPEMSRLLQLLQKSGNGIQFTGNNETYQNKMLELLAEQSSCKKVILLLDLLHCLSLSKRKVLLQKQSHYIQLSAAEQQRLHIVMAYIVDHFKDDISLGKAAALANMTPAAFCKYCKRTTRKTFIELVTDYRVDYAAQQLVNTSHSISQVGFDSGFNDMSHFHKTFKTRMQLSPLCYRNTFLQKLE